MMAHSLSGFYCQAATSSASTLVESSSESQLWRSAGGVRIITNGRLQEWGTNGGKYLNDRGFLATVQRDGCWPFVIAGYVSIPKAFLGGQLYARRLGISARGKIADANAMPGFAFDLGLDEVDFV